MTNTEPGTGTIILTVTEDGLPDPIDIPGQTVTRFVGTDWETGENIVFAVDHRFVGTIVATVLRDGEATVEVEAWQILGKGAF